MRSICCVLLLVCAATAQSQDLKSTIADCDACHGKDGVSARAEVPTIAGISAFAHEEYLLVYKDDARPCEKTEYLPCDCDTPRAATTMCAEAKELSDDQISAIAAHYAGLKFVPAKQEFDAAKAAAGAKVHAAQCEKCHSDNGANADDDASILAGQWMAYLERSFTEYRAEKRDQPKNMKAKLDALSDEEIDALVHFYASQQ